MKRTIYSQLLNWKASSSRKPLMLYGARQVGKTYILKEFGTREFETFIYINCYMNEPVRTLFEQDVDIDRILLGLSALSGKAIHPNSTLIFLDEVQEIPTVVASLKYFCEDRPDIHIAAAGSLLGVMNMENTSFPTGKVDILHMYPMTFFEFLDASGNEQLVELLKNRDNQTVVNSILPKYVELLRQYYFVGGMPAAVKQFIKDSDLKLVRKVQEDILDAYKADISKHAKGDATKARAVFEAIPSQLAKENKKFIFKDIRKGARSAQYETAIQWLVDAGLVYKICRVSKVAIPLRFYMQQEAFKLFILDVGLLGAMTKVPASLILIGNNIFSEYKGAFTENYVLSQLITIPDIVTAYYAKENSTMEIDFIAQIDASLFPIEVKAEGNVHSKSLHRFITVDSAADNLHGFRFSMLGFDHQNWMSNLPLPAVEALPVLFPASAFS